IRASYSDKVEKLISLKGASVKLDLLKFFLQIAWEIKSLDNKKYVLLSERLDEIGRMLGGWIKVLK
ncbi:MAG: four helix bundle protein, partial [Candidatus Staskawiczbacteria bacterium]|nr:four helix bundle protein [Candidatus Staskawiczbacteria bacterium]